MKSKVSQPGGRDPRGRDPGGGTPGGGTPGGSQGLKKGVAKANVRIKINLFSIRKGKIIMKYLTNNKPNFKIVIMIMVKISDWCWWSPNL